MNEYCINALYSGFQGGALAHHGILGMHWGIRRFQPYGQGYDADHEGREVGLAARLGGSGGSFSSTYGRGRSLGSKVKSAASFFGRRAKSAAREAAERASYGAKKAGKNIGRGISRGLDIMNEQSDRFGAMLKKKTDPYIAQGKEFAKSFSSKARIRMSNVSDKAMDAGYRLVTSNGFSSAFNATLGRSGAIKKGMANLGAIAALRSGITTADKRRRSEGPTSSLGGKSLKWDTMTDKSRVQTEDERRLYGATEFEKFRDRQGGALGRTTMRGDLASRQASWGAASPIREYK